MSVAPSNQGPLPVACRGATIREKRQLLDRKEKQRRRAYLASLLFSFLSLLSGGKRRVATASDGTSERNVKTILTNITPDLVKKRGDLSISPFLHGFFFLLFACKITVSDCGGNGEGFPRKTKLYLQGCLPFPKCKT